MRSSARDLSSVFCSSWQAARKSRPWPRRTLNRRWQIARGSQRDHPQPENRHAPSGDEAQGIAIIPDMFKMSFIFGARFGRGVCGPPAGRHLEQPCLHPPHGRQLRSPGRAQSTDLVLVFQTQKGLDRFLKGKGKLTLGVDVAAAGPVGKRFEASTGRGTPVGDPLLFEHSRHLCGSIGRRRHLQIDWKANTLYYGQPVSPAAILAVNSSWRSALYHFTPAVAGRKNRPARAIVRGRARSEPVRRRRDDLLR